MARHRSRTVAMYLLLASAIAVCPCFDTALAAQDAGGVVVDGVAKGSASEKAGLLPGDVIRSWRREPSPPVDPEAASGAIRSPFDLVEVEVEQAPRGRVSLDGARGSRQLRWTMPPGSWGLDLVPPLPAAVRARHDEAKAAVAAGESDRALAAWLEVSRSAAQPAAWLWLTAAKALSGKQAKSQADTAFAEAVAGDRESAFSAFWLGREWGDVLAGRSEFSAARQQYAIALDALTVVSRSEGLAAASVHARLGSVEYDEGRLDLADDRYRQALRMREALAPASLEVATSLNHVGSVAFARGDLESAEDHFNRSLAIKEVLAPETLGVAASLANLGNVAVVRGDLAAGEKHFRQSLAILEAVAPASREVAATLNNLGVLANERGDHAVAEEYYRRSLDIKQAVAPGSIDVATSFNNLGNVAWDRGDLQAARDYYRQSLALTEALAPQGLDTAEALNNLGIVAVAQGDLKGAEEYFRRSLSISEIVSPDGLEVAASLHSLGTLLGERGDVTGAEEHLRKSLGIRERLAPASLPVARCVHSLGEIAILQGNVALAEQRFRESLNIHERLIPGSAAEAESRYGLGNAYRLAGKLEQAAQFLCGALDSLEQQKGRLGGTEEVRSGFAAKYSAYYHDCATTLLELGKPEEALHVLERSRARSLLAMLAERDLLFGTEVPAELERQRKVVDAEYDGTQAKLSALSPAKESEQIDKLVARLRELRAAQDEVKARIKKAAPNYGSLRYPEPLDVPGVRAALDEGTALLFYSVGKSETLLFVVRGGDNRAPVTALRLRITADALRGRVQSFREVIQRGDPAQLPALVAQGRDLYELLLQPAEHDLAAAERVLVSPDGTLHTLPFAALLRQGPRTRDSYLAEWKPVHVVVSATVYAELKRQRRTSDDRAVQLVAFGDPLIQDYDADRPERISDAEVRSAVRGGLELVSLPASRLEVEQIARFYPKRSRVHLGAEVTEEAAKAVGRETRYLHFATHGFVNEHFPLNSALVLSMPRDAQGGRNNGLLQAWEILEQVRLDADLVTLSACETGLGKEMGGEGLVGLTRAFQYAGARSVLASLWSVSDESTADLMTSFYRYLRAGLTKDVALRTAQIEMIRVKGPNSHPFHWAGFELIGDWR